MLWGVVPDALLSVPAKWPITQSWPSPRGRGCGSQEEARCELIEADMFASLPFRADVCILKRVVHDWPDRRRSRY
ncbi:MAG: hypothetical protein GY769_21205 [bacterium]|nr:hypothetical protein [bacterium]